MKTCGIFVRKIMCALVLCFCVFMIFSVDAEAAGLSKSKSVLNKLFSQATFKKAVEVVFSNESKEGAKLLLASVEKAIDDSEVATSPVYIQVYANGDTSKSIGSIYLGKYKIGATIPEEDVANAFAAEYSKYENFGAYYGQGGWNNFKAGKTSGTWNFNGRTVLGYTNLFTMAYEKTPIKYYLSDALRVKGTKYAYASATGYKGLVPENTVADPEKEGYTFKFWSKEGQKSDYFTSSQKINGWTNVVAQFSANTYKVELRGKGGSCVVDGTRYQNYTMDVTYDAPSNLPEFTMNGYTFVGWSTSKNAEDIVDVTTWNIAENKTLYAIWKGNEYTLTLYGNGGTFDGEKTKAITVINGTTLYEDVLVDAERIGYTQSGWFIGNDKSKPTEANFKMKEGKKFDKPMNFNLAAVWTPNVYQVELRGNGGSCVVDEIRYQKYTMDVTYDALSNLPEFTMNGYTFVGWSTSKNAEDIVDVTTWNIAENKTLYAIWKGNEYTLTLYGNGGTFDGEKTKAITVINGTTLYEDVLVDPVKEGYHVAGWFIGNDASKPTTANFKMYDGKKFDKPMNLNLAVVWKPDVYQVELRGNGGSVNGTQKMTVDVAYETATNLPEFKMNSYEFVGWSTSRSADDIIDVSTWNYLGGKTLYAIWTPCHYTLTLYGNGGTFDGEANKSIDVTYKTTTFDSVLQTPVKEGFEFVGWGIGYNAKSANFTNTPGKVYSTQGNLDLVAIWKEIEVVEEKAEEVAEEVAAEAVEETAEEVVAQAEVVNEQASEETPEEISAQETSANEVANEASSEDGESEDEKSEVTVETPLVSENSEVLPEETTEE